MVYYKEVKKISNLDKDRIIGIDFGIRNIVTIGNNIGILPIIIKGGVLKSINQYYNKRDAEIRSIYNRQPIMCLSKNRKEICRKTGYVIQKLSMNRYRKIKDIMHKYSRWIINYCIQHNIGTIVIGYNPNWKQEINLGKMTNQNFVYIPHYTLKEMIKYKSEELGIKVIEQEESHTSKCSFLDNESIEHLDSYMGKRISRGLFRSAKGIIINADVQGAYNSIKKAFPKAFEKLRTDRIEDVGLHPIRINPLIVNRNINMMRN